jgi:Kef-type K+ transport system membrane component KefB
MAPATIRRNWLRWYSMENVWVMAALCIGLAVIATLVAIWFRISTALREIVVGTVAQLVIGALFVLAELGGKTSWISFLAGTGAIVLTFLAGAELDPQIFRTKWKEATVIGLVGFFGPFFGCTAIAHYVLHWAGRPSWLAGVALSTTSVAVVLFFAKMLSKIIPLYPTVKVFNYQKEEGLYFTLMISIGLTFGTISALFGLNHGVISQAQYSYFVATVVGSAVVPTMIANAWFMPRDLLATRQRKSRR